MPTARLRAARTSPATPRAAAARTARRSVAIAVAQGLTAGVVLGFAYRGWMRLISPEPSFSWGGTIAILVTVTVATLAAALCAATLARVRARGRRLAVRAVTIALIVLALGTPPGIVTVPAFVLAGVAWARGDWSARTRRLLVLAAAIIAGASLLTPAFELAELAAWRAAAGVAGYAIVIGVSAWLLAIPARPDPPRVEPGHDAPARSFHQPDTRLPT